MVNRHQKEQILKHLEQHYISPLTQFYVETEVLKRIMLGRPFRVQIGVPDSWRFSRFYQTVKHLSQEAALERLWLFDSYLTNSKHAVFSHDKTLVLGDSFPYFEWTQIEGKTAGLNQLLGAVRLFYFYKGNEEILMQFFEFVQTHSLSSSVVIVGALSETALELAAQQDLLNIADINKPFLESIAKGRSFTNLFSQSFDILLMDAKGRYVKGFSRVEFVRQIDHIKETYLG